MAKKIIDSIGLEYETEHIRQDEEIPVVIQQRFKIAHDASIETDVYVKGDQTYTFPIQRAGVERIISGVEFVSTILDSSKEEEIKRPVYKLVDWLTEKGESFESDRSGIHVHVNLGGYNLFILKNLMRLAGKYEAVFYYLGSMGYAFRGIKNDCTYCRPITLYGPSCMYTGIKYIQIMNLEDLLASNDTEEFFYRYGGLNEGAPCRKYTPIRYGWITLYNLLTEKKTVEFRVFNKTLNPEFILSAINICKAFITRSFSSYTVDGQVNSIYDTSKDKVLALFEEMIYEFSLDSRTADIGRMIISRSPEINLSKKYYLTHLSNPDFNFAVPYTYKTITEEVYKPNFVDIHVLHGER